MKHLALVLMIAAFFGACKSKKKELRDTSGYFPIRSYVQSLIKSLDTASYSFLKVETVEGRSDTTPVTRETIKPYLNEFADIPNLRDPENGSSYGEVKSIDTLIGRAFMSYTAEDPELEVRRQEITVLPTISGSDQVKTVYVEKFKSTDGGSVEKKMLWDIGQFASITTITQNGNNESVHKLKIIFRKN